MFKVKKKIKFKYFHRFFSVMLNWTKIYKSSVAIQGYSRETSDENFVICNPKYKKPLELDILFHSKQGSNPSSLANKINHDTFSLLRLWAKVNIKLTWQTIRQ
jgi:hypothetical protein